MSKNLFSLSHYGVVCEECWETFFSPSILEGFKTYGLNPANGIDMTTASESAGRQIQNDRNLIIKIPQTNKYLIPF